MDKAKSVLAQVQNRLRAALSATLGAIRFSKVGYKLPFGDEWQYRGSEMLPWFSKEVGGGDGSEHREVPRRCQSDHHRDEEQC